MAFPFPFDIFKLFGISGAVSCDVEPIKAAVFSAHGYEQACDSDIDVVVADTCRLEINVPSLTVMEAFKSQALQALLNYLIKAGWKYLRSMRKHWITLFIFDIY